MPLPSTNTSYIEEVCYINPVKAIFPNLEYHSCILRMNKHLVKTSAKVSDHTIIHFRHTLRQVLVKPVLVEPALVEVLNAFSN